MIRLLRGLVAAALPVIVFMSGAQAQTFTQLQWGINRAASPANVCLLNGAACVADNLATLGTAGSRWANLFTSKLTTKLGSNPDSTGQPTGTFAATIYNATNSSGMNGLLVKNNFQSTASTAFEVGNDFVGGAYTPSFKVFGDRTSQFFGATTVQSSATSGVIVSTPFDRFGTFGNNTSQLQSGFLIASSNVGLISPVSTAINGNITVTTGTTADAWAILGTAAVTSTTPIPGGGALGSGQSVGVTGQFVRYNFAAGGDTVNPSGWGGTFTHSDLTGQPSNISGGGLGVEIDFAADGLDPANLRGGLVIVGARAANAAAPAQMGHMLTLTVGDVHGGFGAGNISTDIFFLTAGAFRTAGLDFRLAVQGASANTIWLADNQFLAWNTAGTYQTLFNVNTGRVETRFNTGVVFSIDAIGEIRAPFFTGSLVNSTGLPLTTGVTGILPGANGGTGLASYTTGDLLYASGATALSKLADVAPGNALISGGIGVAPSWGKIGISTHVSGLGTGVATALGVNVGAAGAFLVNGNAFYRCGSLVGANFNSTADQPITISQPDTNYVVQSIQITNPSVSMTTAVGGFYTGAGKTGLAVVANSQVYSQLTTNAANTAGNRMGATVASTSYVNVATIYFALSTPQGVAATADLDIYCIPLR